MASLNGGMMPTVLESTRLLSQAVKMDQTDNKIGMQIKSSKAFEMNNHHELLDIIQKIEKNATSKYRIDTELKNKKDEDQKL